MPCKGVLGRIVDSITSQEEPLKVGAYSMAGNVKIMEGGTPATIVSAKHGSPDLLYPELRPVFREMARRLPPIA